MSEKILKNLKKTRQNQPLCIVSSNSWRRAWYKSHFIGFQGIYCHSKSRDFKGWWRGTLEKRWEKHCHGLYEIKHVKKWIF